MRLQMVLDKGGMEVIPSSHAIKGMYKESKGNLGCEGCENSQVEMWWV